MSPGDIPTTIAEAQSWLARGEPRRARRVLMPYANLRRFEIMLLMGQSWLADGRPEEAVAPLRIAVELDPTQLPAVGNLGAALLESGKPREAVAVLTEALGRHANVAALHFNLGNALLAMGDGQRAKVAFLNAVERDADFAAAWANLGVVAERTGDYAAAHDALSRAVALDPANHHARFNLAVVFERLGAPMLAATEYEAILVGSPGHVDATLNLSALAQRAFDPAKAERLLLEAISRFPDEYRLHDALGAVLLDLGRPHVARDSIALASKLAPDSHSIRLNFALCRLSLGEWPDAWSGFESRLWFGALGTMPPEGIERWEGQSLGDGILLLLAEQGAGDSLQFARFGYDLTRRGVRAMLACERRLVRILESTRAFASVVAFEEIPNVKPRAWAPLMSLPGIMGTTLDSIPALSRYIESDPQLVVSWRERIDSHPRSLLGSSKLHIGIAWQGNPIAEQFLATAGRSPPLAAFAPIAELPGVTLVPLQQGPGREQIDSVAFRDRLALPDAILDAGPDAFVDTAALIESVQLVVTSDTSIAHLAAALGKETWIVLKRASDWRWLHERSDCPWYPSVRLFRQSLAGDWSGPFAEMAALTAQRIESTL